MPLTFCIIFTMAISAISQDDHVFEDIIRGAFAGREGTFVIIDCSTSEIHDFYPNTSSKRIAPCSTFKIWNTLIGLESGLISSSDESFYKWDGIERSILAWNKDLTLQEAFQASCVPAFQSLARKIGPKKMHSWIDKIGYGNKDTSAGIDVFWLPASGRRTILISPMEQAQLIYKLISGNMPFSDKSIAAVKDIMKVRETDLGTLYGKTGTATNETGTYVLGWYVGFVESKGKTYAFACTATGDNVMGKDSRVIVERILMKQGIL